VPTVYKSSDASAPTLTGQVGALIGVLDACLVNGYGSKSAAGWTKAFSGTNLASYLPSAGHYLDVNDAAAGAGGAQEATVRGYESMTAVGTGTNAFPTTAQIASPGEFIRKSATADATARGWLLIADQYTFYLFILSGDTAAAYQSFGFGRFYSTKASDTYRSFICGHSSTGSGSSTGLDSIGWAAAINNATTGMFIPRTAAGTGTAITSGIVSPMPTSVARMTEKVRKRMRSRPGKGSPASVSSGSASAAARDTAPRIPAHDTKTAPRQLDMRRAIHFGACNTANTHTNRSAITAPLTSAA